LGYISQQLSIIGITRDGELGSDAMCDSLAHDFPSAGAIGSAESTKKGIHEQADFQGKIPEDSQTTRTQLNNNSLTSHEVCWIIEIAMFLSSERYLIA
jgi:hypothetical protein